MDSDEDGAADDEAYEDDDAVIDDDDGAQDGDYEEEEGDGSDDGGEEVREVLSISEAFARTLLRHYKWDKEKLLTQFFEMGKEDIYRRAGVAGIINSMYTGSFTCSVCFDTVDGEDTLQLSCGHRFCNNCWASYISFKIRDGEAKSLYCMAKNCNALFDDSNIASFVDRDTLEKYSRKMMDSYVEDNKHVKWCPSIPFCGNCIEISSYDKVSVEVTCNCGLEFCFMCLSSVHSPASCEMVALWKKKCEDDSETAHWLSSNTKSCPKCGNVIEKRDGCNLMTCRCGQYFCWLCGAATGFAHTWTSIEGHTCGRYEEATKEASNSETALKRYMFYYERFIAHDQSRKIAPKLLEQIERAKVELNDMGLGVAIFPGTLDEAHAVVMRARRSLAWSYVFAFYMFSGPIAARVSSEIVPRHKNLFEDYQTQLEGPVELLSSLTMTPGFQMTFEKMGHMKNLTAHVTKRLAGLHDIISNHILEEGDYKVVVAEPAVQRT
ncbi:RING/U-box superfamily protein [Pelomyxa schiedti]|nr:RING/U-box superfamily protein [Pelomyxa schiedti]